MRGMTQMKLATRTLLILGLVMGFAVCNAPAHADFVITATELDASNNVVATTTSHTGAQSLTFVSIVGDFGIAVAGFSNSNTATSQGVVTNVTLDISTKNVTTGYTLRLVLSDDRFAGSAGSGGILANSISTTAQPKDGSASSYGFVNTTKTSTVTLAGLVTPPTTKGAGSTTKFVL